MKKAFLILLCAIALPLHAAKEAIQRPIHPEPGTLTHILTSWTRATLSWVSNAFSSIKRYFFNSPTHELIGQQHATAAKREQSFHTRYLTIGIPPEMAQIAGTLDRMEEDVKTYRAAISDAQSKWDHSILQKEIDSIDRDVDVYMSSVEHIIKKWSDVAFKTKNVTLIKFIHILQSRTFLTEMLGS